MTTTRLSVVYDDYMKTEVKKKMWYFPTDRYAYNRTSAKFLIICIPLYMKNKSTPFLVNYFTAVPNLLLRDTYFGQIISVDIRKGTKILS